MKVDTKQKDTGSSSLMDGAIIPKYDLRFELLGTLDELNSHLGLIRATILYAKQKIYVKTIQSLIITVSAYIADNHSHKYLINDNDVTLLKDETDELRKLCPEINSLIIPGENELAARIDIARTVARRAERFLSQVHENYPVSNIILRFINCLSDYLFVMARYIEHSD